MRKRATQAAGILHACDGIAFMAMRDLGNSFAEKSVCACEFPGCILLADAEDVVLLSLP